MIEPRKPETPEPAPFYYEHFTAAFLASGTVIECYYAGGATLREVQVTHPLATVAAVEDSRVSAEADRP